MIRQKSLSNFFVGQKAGRFKFFRADRTTERRLKQNWLER